MAVHLVADSTCDISAADAARMDVRIVPLKVIIGDEQFDDGVDIDPATLYARMRSSTVVPRTSQPTPAQFQAVFDELTAHGDSVVCTTISSAMSGTHGSATQARDALAGRDIHVVDTRQVGPTHRQVVEALHASLRAGADATGLVALAATIHRAQRLTFTVETLEYLRRGGRIGGARAMLGSMLNIKPILEVTDGTVEPVDRVRTFQRALDRLVDELRGDAARWGGETVVAVTHADLPAQAADLARRAAEVTGSAVPVYECGPVIGCHGGPGAIGIAAYRAP